MKKKLLLIGFILSIHSIAFSQAFDSCFGAAYFGDSFNYQLANIGADEEDFQLNFKIGMLYYDLMDQDGFAYSVSCYECCFTQLFDSANKYFSKCIDLNKHFAPAYYYRAITSDFWYPESIRSHRSDINKAIRLEPDNPEYYFERAQSRFFYSKKLKDFRKAINLDRSYCHSCLRSLPAFHFFPFRYKTKKDYDFFMNNGCDSLAVIHQRANDYYYQKQYFESIIDYTYLIENNLTNDNLFNYFRNRGYAFFQTMQYEMAAKDFLQLKKFECDRITNFKIKWTKEIQKTTGFTENQWNNLSFKELLELKERQKLIVFGEVKELSIDPQGSVWLSSSCGNIYKIPNFDSSSLIPIRKNRKTKAGHFEMDFDRISFFNTDTAMLTGFIAKEYHNRPKMIYRTLDGGKRWNYHNVHEGWVGVNEAFTSSNGKAWLADSDGRILYSDDFGENWEKIFNFKVEEKRAFGGESYANSCQMINDSVGLVTDLYNQIAYTTDNFKTTRKIQTPLDCGIIKSEVKYYSRRNYHIINSNLYKAKIFNEFVIVHQYRNLYYSRIDTINWKVFPYEISEFEVDPLTKRLYVITKDWKVGEVLEDLSLQIIDSTQITSKPVSLKVFDGNVYVHENRVVDYDSVEYGHIYKALMDENLDDITHGSFFFIPVEIHHEPEKKFHKIYWLTVHRFNEEGHKEVKVINVL